MADKADTWMALYIGAYLGDTMHLSRQQHGSYLLLIMAAYKNAGWLPNDDGLLAQIAKCSAKEWKAERSIMAAFFDVTGERWTHRRVTLEWEKAQRLTEQRRAAGTASATKRQRDGNGRSTVVATERQQSARPSEEPSPSPSVTTTSSVACIGRAHALPEDWKPSEDDLRTVKAGRPDLTDAQIAAETERFRNHAKANARTAHNWGPNWRNWVTKAKPAAHASETFDQTRIRLAREAVRNA